MRKWPDWLVLLLLLLVLVQFVRFVWVVVTPVQPLGNWHPGKALIIPNQERHALFASFDPFFRSVWTERGSAVVTSLDLTLFGVNVNEASGQGSAIIAERDGVQISYGAGDEIVPGVKLENVAFDHIVLDRAGTKETLYLDQSVPAETIGSSAEARAATKTATSVTSVTSVRLSSPAKVAPEKIAPAKIAKIPDLTGISATVVVGAKELSLADLARGIAFTSRRENNRMTGVIVQPRGDGSAFRAVGLESGDIITSVNGRPIGLRAQMVTELAKGGRIHFKVKRGAEVIPFSLSVRK